MWLVNNNYFNSLSHQWCEIAKYVGTRKLWRVSRMHRGGLGRAGNREKKSRLIQKMLALAEIQHFFCLSWFYCRLQETELVSWPVKACTLYMGVLAFKGLYLSKSVSNFDQEFAWAAIIPKSLYFWCHLIALKFLCVSWSSPQKPHGHKLHMRPCKDEVQGRGQNMCLGLILAPAS